MPGILWRASLRETLAPSRDSLVPVDRVCADYFRGRWCASAVESDLNLAGALPLFLLGFFVFVFIPCCFLLIVQTWELAASYFSKPVLLHGFCHLATQESGSKVYFHLVTSLRPHTRSCDGCKYSAKQPKNLHFFGDARDRGPLAYISNSFAIIITLIWVTLGFFF